LGINKQGPLEAVFNSDSILNRVGVLGQPFCVPV